MLLYIAHILIVLSLQVELGTHPCQHIQMVNLVVVDCSLVYNVIIGRPTLNVIRAITSNYNLMVKFPTVWGIGVLKEHQQESQEIFKVTNRPSKVNRINSIMIGNIEVKPNKVRKFDELDSREPLMEQHGEPVEELVEIQLFEDQPEKTCKMGRL